MSCPPDTAIKKQAVDLETTPTNAGPPHAASSGASPPALAAFIPTECQCSSHNRSSFRSLPAKGQLYDRRAQRELGRIPPPVTLRPRSNSTAYHDDTDSSNHWMEFSKFSIFNALLNYSELTFEMVKYLEPTDLLTLYSVSRDFHALANTRFTTMILSQSLSKAPESSRIFLFRCYRSLCIRDPAQRANAVKENFEVRFVPGFQWLQMILFRERTVDDIVACLEREGLMLPRATTLTIKKIWFTMDLPTNALRGGLIRNRAYWTDQDLYLANLFITKLDMLLTCPLSGVGDLGLRRMLLGQRSLATLAAVLKREEMRNEYEMLKMIVAWNYTLSPEQQELNLPVLGIQPKDVGMLQYEGWGRNPGVLFNQIDTLVTVESVSRGLDMPKHLMDMVLYGFVDKGPGLDIWTVGQKRRMEKELERQGGGTEGEKSAVEVSTHVQS